MTRAAALATALLLAAACSKDSAPKPGSPPAPEAARPAPTETGDVAVVNVEGQLLAVAMNGSTKPFVKGGAGWCATDNKARVIWYTTEDELRYVDLEDGASRVAITGIDGLTEVIIDYGSNEQIGGYDEVRPDVALRVDMSAAPSVGAKVLCDGDAWVYCYQEHEAAQEDKEVLSPELDAKRKAYAALKPYAPDKLAALVARGADRSLWIPDPKVDESPKVAVDPSNCDEDPETCGDAQVLPTTPPIWSVVVSNSRGDYYHEDSQLYDPASKEFFLAEDPAKRSPTPLANESGAGVENLLIAPSGKAYVMGDTVATWSKIIWHVDDAFPCGWIGPVFRIPGPRG